MRPIFSVLTKAEEEAGLYESPSTIGFEENWRRLLEQKGLAHHGHELVQVSDVGQKQRISQRPILKIARHRTAMVRDDLSKQVKLLLQYNLLKPGRSFFDYGCGHGNDIQNLKSLGFEAAGWDPTHRTHEALVEADVVNLGYVLNVIEDPAERVEALARAWSLRRNC